MNLINRMKFSKVNDNPIGRAFIRINTVAQDASYLFISLLF